MAREISEQDDVIDSRDVIERIAELEAHRDDEDYVMDQDEADELTALLELAEQGENLEDWNYGATLVRDTYFEDYARELAEGIGAVSPDAAWPLTYIDWERAAEALLQDYNDVTFRGVTYWAR